MRLCHRCHWPGTHLEMWKERNHLEFVVTKADIKHISYTFWRQWLSVQTCKTEWQEVIKTWSKSWWIINSHHCCSGFLHNTWNPVHTASGSYGRACRRLAHRCKTHQLYSLHLPCTHLTAIVWKQKKRVIQVSKYKMSNLLRRNFFHGARSDFYARDLPATYPRVFCVPFLRRERCADSDWQCRSLCSPKHRASSWWRWSSWGRSPRKRPRGILTAWDTQPRSDALTESAWFSCFICCAAYTLREREKKIPCRKWLKWSPIAGLESWNPQKFSREVSARCSRSFLPRSPGMISLYMWTCLSSRPSPSTTKAEGWNFKESPTVRKWPSTLRFTMFV